MKTKKLLLLLLLFSFFSCRQSENRYGRDAVQKKDTVEIPAPQVTNITITNTYDQRTSTGVSLNNVDNSVTKNVDVRVNNTENTYNYSEKNNTSIDVRQDNSTHTNVIQQQVIEQIDY